MPLHASAAGKKYGRTSGSLEVTSKVDKALLRLPLWQGLGAYQDHIIEIVIRALITAQNSVMANHET